jgi:hypothetical protein
MIRKLFDCFSKAGSKPKDLRKLSGQELKSVLNSKFGNPMKELRSLSTIAVGEHI